MNFIDLPNTRLNVARTGATTAEMLQQAQDLVRKARESNEFDFDNDWKLVTIHIGANDVCDLPCLNGSESGPQDWAQNVVSGLDFLRDNLPRTFVNLVQVNDLGDMMTTVTANSSMGPVCEFFYSQICPCGPLGSRSLGEQFDELRVEFNQMLQNIVDTMDLTISPWLFNHFFNQPNFLSLMGKLIYLD